LEQRRVAVYPVNASHTKTCQDARAMPSKASVSGQLLQPRTDDRMNRTRRMILRQGYSGDK
jgi:hypothetical protein